MRIDTFPCTDSSVWCLTGGLWKSFPLPGAIFLQLPEVVADSIPSFLRPNNTFSKSSHPTALTLSSCL